MDKPAMPNLVLSVFSLGRWANIFLAPIPKKRDRHSIKFFCDTLVEPASVM